MGRRNNPKAQRRDSLEIDMFSDWIDHIKNASKKNYVLVSNKRAKDTLEYLGIKNVLYLTNYQPRTDLYELIIQKPKDVILLLDVDKKSNSEAHKVKTQLEKIGAKVNTRFRKVILTSEFRTIAGLRKYLHKHVANSLRKHKGVEY